MSRSPSQTCRRQQPPLPDDFVKVLESLCGSIDRRLGYIGDERFVLFSYEPRCDGVVWKDGRSSGFGAGAWSTFVYEVSPLADLYDFNLGNCESRGWAVLVLDRETGDAWFAPRSSAEDFVVRALSSKGPRP